MKICPKFLGLFVLFAIAGAAAADDAAAPLSVNLLKSKWTGAGSTEGKTTTTFSQDENGVSYTVKNFNNNTNDTGPHLDVPVSARDGRAFQTLKLRMRLTSDLKAIMANGKLMTFSFYDNKTKRELNAVGIQQNLDVQVNAGDWQDISINIRQIGRSQMGGITIWPRLLPYGVNHEYKMEISRCELVGAADPVFDGEGMSGPLAPASSPSAQQLTTKDGLGLKLGQDGSIAGLMQGDRDIGNGARSGGILVRDHANNAPPVPAGGSLRPGNGGLAQTADLPKLNLHVEGRYQVEGNLIHLSMKAVNLTKENRFLTLYFAIPLQAGAWTWWSDMNNGQLVGGQDVAGADGQKAPGPFYEETTDRYPLAAMTSPDAGVALAIPLDQPRNYRLEYNEATGLLYVAFDVALADIATPSGGSLNEVSCEAYLYACDPQWGMRSALQTYYTAFPQWFTKHVKRDGGWEMSGARGGMTPEHIIASGCRFDWTTEPNEQWTWNAQNGVLNGIYVEPEYVQLSMTDVDPSDENALNRLNKLSVGDTEEWKKIEHLHYTGAYKDEPYSQEHGLLAYHQMLAQAALVSGLVTADGKPSLGVGYRGGWIGENGLGMMVPCNLDPQIPHGRGEVAYELLESKAKGYLDSKKLVTNSWSLDSYQCDETYDYKKENFTYSPFPLTYERDHAQLAVPVRLTMAAWIKGLAERSLPDKVIFGNLIGNYTFSAPYLDIFGTEGGSVEDPAYMRAMSYRRPMTYLPYTPKPDLDVFYNLLYGAYPGRGIIQAQYDAIVPLLDQLTEAGWEPLTYAKSDAPKVRVERFGSGDHCYLVCYNTDPATGRCHVTLDKAGLKGDFQKATALFGSQKGHETPITEGTFSVQLTAHQTTVFKLE